MLRHRIAQPMFALALAVLMAAFPAGPGDAADPRAADPGAANPSAANPSIDSVSMLVGAWRLLTIEYRGPAGETVDPFYQAGSTGILIYAASGWMSVQISAPGRPAWAVPEIRAPASADGLRARKATAFDTYYAYFGRWDFDPATSVVTHRVESSLLPAETGRSYTQGVSFERGLLVFTNRSGPSGRETLRRKVWERLPGAP